MATKTTKPALTIPAQALVDQYMDKSLEEKKELMADMRYRVYNRDKQKFGTFIPSLTDIVYMEYKLGLFQVGMKVPICEFVYT